MNPLEAFVEYLRPYVNAKLLDASETQSVNMPGVKQAIFNREATIVYFDDGTKCIVRKSAQDTYNREHAIVYAIVKRAYGTVDENGVVQGNGMGTMLARVVKNGYDQEAYQEQQKNKKTTEKKIVPSKYDLTPQEECANCDEEDCPSRLAPYKNQKYDRDSKGRFVKKANRK